MGDDRAAGVAFVGIAFRQCHPDHASVAETVRASAAHPSRFIPPGGRFGVLYVALARDTAAAELHRRAAQLGVPISALTPRAMLTLAVRLQRVLDLTDAAVRTAWGIDLAKLGSDDYAQCQEVALAARDAGYEAIWYPSAALAGLDASAGESEQAASTANLAIFADRLHPGSEVRVVRREELSLGDE